MTLSIIIPTLNEEQTIATTLERLDISANDVEVIIVDGQSTDKTKKLLQHYNVKVLDSSRGRSSQMNIGANAAQGEILLFLHADTYLPPDYQVKIESSLSRRDKCWGYFDIRLDGHGLIFRIIEKMINLRTAITCIASGDQAIFIRRSTFKQIGGFADIALMEDIAISHRLKHLSRPSRITSPAVTSSRRWNEHGIIRTILLMWSLRLSYYIGIDPGRLKTRYK